MTAITNLIDELNRTFAGPIGRASDLVFGPWTIALLFAVGIFLTVRLGFVQFVHFGAALKAFFGADEAKAKGALSPFQTFMTALGATIGTGNIAGVATAIVTGGPGALFWIWAWGLIAMAVKFTEAVLGVYYRRAGEGGLLAGPMIYLTDGLKMPRMGWLYAFVAGVAALTTTPFTQPNSIADVMNSQWGIPKIGTGVVLAILCFVTIIGGVKSIGRALEKAAPLKVLLYLTGGAIVLISHAADLPAAFNMILRGAFTSDAAFGGTAGAGIMLAMRYGIARGIYANEAGYGTAAVVYGAARSKDPFHQGLNAIMEVFIVSFVTSSISALSIIVTGVYKAGPTGAAAVAGAFESVMPGVGGSLVTVCVFLFGYTSLTGWSYYGEQTLEFIFGRRVVLPYRWIYCALVVVGATSKVDLVWNWGDLMNSLQIFPNLIGIVGLSGVAAKIVRDRQGS
ncbi:MAG: sodium:alanine symporter family protein [Vicinamibacteria bacterium]|nr:sodium:alanine symporter family protein [Vicinamibacteria bacterium]MBP9945346.1 sodium:alanine symporter family protein [Vicinamibacteria bacterium]